MKTLTQFERITDTDTILGPGVRADILGIGKPIDPLFVGDTVGGVGDSGFDTFEGR